MTHDIFNAPTSPEARTERAARAVKAFRGMQAGLTGYAQAITGRRDVTVELAQGTPRTDGKKIYFKPPIALGDLTSHERGLCDRRDRVTKQQMCTACRIREEVLITIYHEIAHIVFGTFETVSEEAKIEALERAIEEVGGKYEERIRAAWGQLPFYKKNDYLNLSSLVNPFLPILVNALEDARVDADMFRARKGTKVMFDAYVQQVFASGIENDDGTFGTWAEKPLNSQVLIGVFVLACEYTYEGWFDPKVEEALGDTRLRELVRRIDTARSAQAVYNLSFPILARLRELGFCKLPEEPEDETPEEEPEDEPQRTEASDDVESSEQEDSNEEADQTSQDEDGSPDGEEDDSQAGEDGSDQGDDAGSESSSDDASGDRGEDRESDDSSDEASDDGSSGDAGADEDASSDSSDSGAGESEPDADGEAGPSQGEGEAGEPSDDRNASENDNGGTSSDEGQSEGPGSDDGSDDDESGDVSGTGVHGEGDQERSDFSDGSLDDSDSDDGELIDTGADEGEGGKRTEHFEYGTHENVLEDVQVFGKHEAEVGEPSGEDMLDENAVDVAIIQGMYFEKPSANVTGVREHKYNSPYMQEGRNMSTAWDDDEYEREYQSRLLQRYGIEADVTVSEQILGPALLEMRKTFSDNARAKMERHMRSGKINQRVLGKRAWAGDDRLFQKKRLPGKKSYSVLIGIDISGSTMGLNIALAKRAAMAQAELCNRAGIEFAVYAHTANGSPTGGWGREIYLDVYEIKGFDTPWSDTAKEALSKISADSENLDGHTIEYYRKMIERRNSTDRVILYYSDGKMPAANHDEELEILKREIAYCKSRNITLLGVGIRTDSPRRHGLETVQVDDDSDISKVVRHLETALLHRR